MDKLKCIIVDDEKIARDILEQYISNVVQLELVASYRDGLEAFNNMHGNTVDLVFLDIQMPGLLGTSLAKMIKNKPKVIFTTAYSDYAVEGFELEALDYLVKPFSFERFLKAVNKALSVYQLEQNNITRETGDRGFTYIKSKGMMTKVFYDDILFIESQRNCIHIHTATQKHISYMTISSIEERLPSSLFFRLHRSFIIAIDKVQAYSPHAIKIGDRQIAIGKEKKEAFLNLMNAQ